jgi:SAM-dependent methyltransferase
MDRELNYGREQLDRMFAEIPSARVAVDLGVGTGADLLRLKLVHPGARLLGVDFSETNLERIQSIGVEPLRLNVECDAIPIESGSVDVVIANQVFEHLKEVFWCMHECCRILADGGHFVLGVPNLASFHNRILLLAGYQPTCIQVVGPHVRGFTAGGVRQLVAQISGGCLSELSFEGANFYPLPARLARPTARLFPGAAASIFFHFSKVAPYRAAFIERIRREPFETNYYVGQRQEHAQGFDQTPAIPTV